MGDVVSTREELECSNCQHEAMIAMQVLNCNNLDAATSEDDGKLRDLAVKKLITYLSPKSKKKE